ncbi:MAG: response regulator [Candidatus Kapaibacteriota bacterium]
MGIDDHYSVVIADDFALVRLGVKAFVELEPRFKVVGEASNGLEALEMIERLSPHLAIVDIVMPQLDGISLAKELKERGNPTKVLLMTAVEDFVDIRSAFYSRADGIIIKSIAQKTFVDAMYSIINGKKVYCKNVFHLLFNKNSYLRKNYEILKFSLVQQKIISRRLRGYLFPEIAQDLNLTVSQVAQELTKIIESFEESELVFETLVK